MTVILVANEKSVSAKEQACVESNYLVKVNKAQVHAEIEIRIDEY